VRRKTASKEIARRKQVQEKNSEVTKTMGMKALKRVKQKLHLCTVPLLNGTI